MQDNRYEWVGYDLTDGLYPTEEDVEFEVEVERGVETILSAGNPLDPNSLLEGLKRLTEMKAAAYRKGAA